MSNTFTPLKINSHGKYVKKLHNNLLQLGYNISQKELDDQLYGKDTQKAILDFQSTSNLSADGIYNKVTSTTLATSMIRARKRLCYVTGSVYYEYGLPANGVSLIFYNCGFAGTKDRLGTAISNAQGSYSFSYVRHSSTVNLEVYVLDAKNQEEFKLNVTHFNAGRKEDINLIIPSEIKPMDSEFNRLHNDLKNHVETMSVLKRAKESKESRDLTLLSRASGWDARLIALAAKAAKLEDEVRQKLKGEKEIPISVLYGLLRIGLPSDMEQLGRMGSDILLKALDKAVKAGIIDSKDIDGMEDTIKVFAQRTLLDTKAPGELSSYNDLLKAAAIPEEKRYLFMEHCMSFQGGREEFWKKAEAILGSDVEPLRLQGKLANLTLNNALLIKALQEKLPSSGELSLLVDKGFHEKAAWKELITNIAGKGASLDNLIPKIYSGEEIDSLDAYSEDLARKVRLSYPNRVIRNMISTNVLQTSDDVVKPHIMRFLDKAETLDFKLGRVPVNTFIKKHDKTIFSDADNQETRSKVINNVKTFYRLYQLTPSNDSMTALNNTKLTSAQDIVKYPYEVFVKNFSSQFKSKEEMELVYRKAQQVNAVTLNYYASSQHLAGSPALYSVSGNPEDRNSAINQLKENPTMETLFGDLDYSDSDESHSVLSPAAYLVDLLEFLNADYLEDKPYDVLRKRRPDLENLQLTDENTNVAMPYIDLVNEILEYYVVNNNGWIKSGLDGYKGHDTKEATSAELLAEPQYIETRAYDILSKECYPLNLPFDLWLDTIRQFFEYFKTPLWEVLDTFRKSDRLFSEGLDSLPVSDETYYRAAVYIEYLDITPDEYRLFTEVAASKEWYKLYGYTGSNITDNMVISELKSAKTMSRKLGLTYKELVEIIKTDFINSELSKLSIITKLDLDINDIIRYFMRRGTKDYTEEQKAVEAKFDEFDIRYHLNKDTTKQYLEKIWNSGAFNRILVLRDMSGLQSSFDHINLEYAIPNLSAPSKIDMIKINLFVRLWKKLGWTIEETDRALHVFLPYAAGTLSEANLGSAFKTALIYFAHLKALDKRIKTGKQNRLNLLSLWSGITTIGKNSLYTRLFLSSGVSKDDPIFDHAFGEYLTIQDRITGSTKPFTWDRTKPEDAITGNVSLKNHLFSIQAALNLTTDEMINILKANGKSIDEEPLTLANLSLLYNYKLLSKALKLTVIDFITLVQLSGINPFGINKSPLIKVEDDYPYSHTLKIIEQLEKIKETSFKLEDLRYLIGYQYDPVGKYRTDSNLLLQLVKSVAEGIKRIQAENAVPSDITTFTDDMIKQKLSLILPSDVIEQFLAMWNGTIEYSVETEIGSELQLTQEEYAVEANICQLSYDEIRKTQALTFRGVLLEEQKMELLKVHPSPVFSRLLDQVQQKAYEFFRRNLMEQYSDLITADDFKVLFLRIPEEGIDDNNKQSMINDKRKLLACKFLPILQKKLINTFLVQLLTSNLNTDTSLSEALLTDSSLLTEPHKPGGILLDAFTSVAENGVSVEYFDVNGVSINKLQNTSVDTALRPTADFYQLLMKGYLEVKTAGVYRFYVRMTDYLSGTDMVDTSFYINDLSNPLLQGKVNQNIQEISKYIELKPNVPYQFVLLMTNPGKQGINLLIQGENLPKGSLDRLVIYPKVNIERFDKAKILLEKALQLIKGFGLSGHEIRYLLTHSGDFQNLNLSMLPTSEKDVTPELLASLFQQFLLLSDYAGLKRDLAGGTDDLISIFESAKRKLPASSDAAIMVAAKEDLVDEILRKLSVLTRHAVYTIQEITEHFGLNAVMIASQKEVLIDASDYTKLDNLLRLWNAMKLTEKLGVPAEKIAGWTEIVIQPSDNRAVIAGDLKNTMKACYEADTWRRIAQLIFNKLRQSRRDALVALIIHNPPEGRQFEDINNLFEYFLIDPGMEPVVQTSRIRTAISSVQTFIQRCLMNLEPEVKPSNINSEQWKWMKRYRVWDANRKIFLYPENWLEPEFRDDKTFLFSELESKLLQEDITNELAEEAFYKYLKKLEKIARLEIITLYYEKNAYNPKSGTLHVIGRTRELPNEYYYRRYSNNMWTPWEPISANIEGNHVVAVIWCRRLHLFWLTFIDKGSEDQMIESNNSKNLAELTFSEFSNMGINALTTLKKKVEVQLNWIEYYQGQWTSQSSSGLEHSLCKEVNLDFDKNKVFLHATNIVKEDGSDIANIYVGAPIKGRFELISKQCPPKPLEDNASIPPYPPYVYKGDGVASTLVETDNNLILSRGFLKHIGETTIINKTEMEYSSCNEIFRLQARDSNYRAALLFNQEAFFDPKDYYSEFFYQDSEHTFFIDPELYETKSEDWDWIEIPPDNRPDTGHIHDRIDWIDKLEVIAISKEFGRIPHCDPLGIREILSEHDWLTNPATAISFDDSIIVKEGGLDYSIVSEETLVKESNEIIEINSGSAIKAGSAEISFSNRKCQDSGFSIAVKSFNVVGSKGLTTGLASNIKNKIGIRK